jgi:hypothetical protein
MPRTRPPYSPEFRRQMVELVRAGRDPAELARVRTDSAVDLPLGHASGPPGGPPGRRSKFERVGTGPEQQ